MLGLRPFRSATYFLLLWNAGILCLCLLGFCGLFREILRVRLLLLLDNQLVDRSNGLIELWRSIPAVAQDTMRDEINTGALGARLFVPDGSSIIADPAPDDSLTGIYRPRAFTPDGTSYFKGVNDKQLDHEAFLRSLRGEMVHSTVSLRGQSVRVVSVPVKENGETLFVLQSARSLNEYHSEMSAVTRELLRSIPLLLVVSAVGGWILTNRAMKPVRQLRQATERIGASDLSLRLPLRGDDEFTSLTDTLNKMLARLESAFEQQARFTADASHELRTPLTVLRGNTSLALTGDRSAAEYRSTIERTHKAVCAMSTLVDQLLLLSRADANQILIEPERIELKDVVLEAIERVSAPGAASAVIDLCSDECIVIGVQSLLCQVVMNLIHNAQHHSSPEDTIEVRVRIDTRSAVLTVEDDGDGIAAEHLPHVMERFYRTDKARAAYQGNGLGLAICKSIIEAHKGSMSISSEPGEGTCVRVMLPLADTVVSI